MIYLDVACNNPDNGLFLERATMMQIGCAEFQANDWERGVAFIYYDHGIRIAGKCWRVEDSKDWVGNWCWNRYRLGEGTARTLRWYMTDFVRWLRGRKLFSLDTAPTKFFEWWEGEIELSPSDIHTLVCELEE